MAQNKTYFDIGEDLYGVSLDELAERIDVLHAEVTRIQAEIDKKTVERSVADKIFGKN